MRLSSRSAAITAWCFLTAGVLGAAPQGEVSITEYGAKGDGKELCTEAINRALSTAAEAGGGTVLVPAGTFLTGAIKLPSRVTLHLGPGAVLLGSTNLADYQVSGRRYPLIRAEKAENIAILGPGVIDGGNFDLRPAYDTHFAIFKHDTPAVFSRYTDGLTIHRLELEWDDDQPDFFDHAIFCEHFTHLVIDAFHGRPPHQGGTDAVIALHHGRDAILRNCIADEGTTTFLSHEDVAGNVLLANNDLAHAVKLVSPTTDNFTSVGNLVSR